MSKTIDTIKKQFADNPVILYMKGNPDFPSCGFSAKAVGIMKSHGVDFAYVDVLQAPFIRERLKEVTDWPTFPQLIINGELVGGSDIIEELNASGELPTLLKAATETSEA